MLVSVYCIDAPGSDEARQTQLQAHCDHIREIKHLIRIAGPIMSEDGQRAISSLLVFEVEGPAEAEALMQQDPYYQAGVWKEMQIRQFRGVTGSWAGDDAIL